MVIFQSDKRVSADKALEDSFSNQFLQYLSLLLPLPLYPNHLNAYHLPLFSHHLHFPYLLPLPYKTTPILL